MGGPGLATVAKVGQPLSVMVGGGPPVPAHVSDVNRDLCDEGDPADTCLFVGVEYGSESEPVDADSLPALWKEPGASDDVIDDVALLDARLAVAADTALPRFVPHTLAVHYANALCEGDVDSKDHVLLRTYSSAGADPLKDVPALRDWRRYPRRVVTLRALDRTLHFVTVAKLARPRSGRMSDIPRKYETAFWILEAVGSATNVLHHERNKDARSITTDTSCQLPLRYPTPWGLVESDGIVHVLTRSSVTLFQRWSLQADRLTREGEWKADVNELG